MGIPLSAVGMNHIVRLVFLYG